MNLRDLLFSADLSALNNVLDANPALANEGISLPDNPAMAHPLHRICDGVFRGDYSEETGLALAKMFLDHGATVNGTLTNEKDSPLIAACSLGCDQLALLYIQQGARVDHRGTHGGTALHWASWCGRDVVVHELLKHDPDINLKCTDFKSTPLFWAIHGYKSGGNDNLHHQVSCARILLEHGADPSIPNFEGYLPKQLAGEDDTELLALFSNR